MKKETTTKGTIFVISGPSGSGKTTLVTHVLGERVFKKQIARPVSFTTRPKRSKERNGKDYWFISDKYFKALRRAKKILEWTRYLGYYYATPKEIAEKQLKSGRHIILCLDLKGALLLKKLCPGRVVTIFVIPPSLDILHHRIRNRCHKTANAEIKQRIALAEQELAAASKYDYCLLNEDLTKVTKDLKKIILKHING